jgi:hypothetical protein
MAAPVTPPRPLRELSAPIGPKATNRFKQLQDDLRKGGLTETQRQFILDEITRLTRLYPGLNR